MATPLPPEPSPTPDAPPASRRRRRYVRPVLRHAIIASWGVLLATIVSYVLRKMGY